MSDLENEMQAWMKENGGIFTRKIKPKDLPEKSIVPGAFQLSVKNQGTDPSCTSHALSSMWELLLRNEFKETVVIDAKDLWEKQLKYGTAGDQGDTVMGAAFIADKYGMKFETASGIRGVFWPSRGVEITHDPSKKPLDSSLP